MLASVSFTAAATYTLGRKHVCSCRNLQHLQILSEDYNGPWEVLFAVAIQIERWHFIEL